MYSIRKQAPPATKHSRKRLFLIIGAAVLGLVILVAVLELTNTTHFFHAAPLKNYETQANKPNRTINSGTKGEDASQNTKKNDNTANQTAPLPEDSKQNTTTPGITGELVTPTNSTFVSNHRPQNNSELLQSVCNTSAGATCQMIFTNNGTTKSLPAQMTDRGGATYWTWSPSQIGLTAGTWTIQATATAGSQSQSETDTISLEVK